jgi:hypothetical protein
MIDKVPVPLVIVIKQIINPRITSSETLLTPTSANQKHHSSKEQNSNNQRDHQ